MLLLGVVVAAFAVPDAATLQASWEKWRPALDSQAHHPFRFDESAWSKIAQGEVAKRRDRLEGTDRVIGALWVDANIDTTWLAIHDPHGDYIDGAVYETLPGSTSDHSWAYQR